MEKLILKYSKKTTANNQQNADLQVELTPEEIQQMSEAVQGGVNPMFMLDAWNIFRDNYHTSKRAVWIMEDICDETCTDVIKQLNFWNDGSGRPVYIYINSPGGSGTICMSIVDSINALKSCGHQVFTINVGFAASAAAIIYCAGSDGCRYAYPSARFMFHHGHYEFLTDLTTDELTKHKKELQILDDAITDVIATVTKKSKADVNKMLAKDLYLSVKEAKKLNIVNKIGVLVV